MKLVKISRLHLNPRYVVAVISDDVSVRIFTTCDPDPFIVIDHTLEEVIAILEANK